MSSGPRYAPIPAGLVLPILTNTVERCLDCGSIVLIEDKPAHTRFHSILSGHAWAIAVLKNAHIAAHVHDKYEAYDKINDRKFDSWSASALAEVVKERNDEQVGDSGLD